MDINEVEYKIMMSGRLSGRTSRMLAKAVELAKSGRVVYILCANKQQVITNKRLFLQTYNSSERSSIENSIKFKSLESLGRNNVDLENTRLRNAHHNCVLLIDHQFYTHHFPFVLCGYHLYDKEYSIPMMWNIK